MSLKSSSFFTSPFPHQESGEVVKIHASLRRLTTTLTLCSLLLVNALPQPAYAQSTPDQIDAQVDTLLQKMTLEQRVGQMFMVSLYGKGLPDVGKDFVEKMMPGSIALFGYNGTSPSEINATINAWQSAVVKVGANVPMLVGIDHEGGPVTRLTEGVTPLPWGAALGAMTTDDAYAVGKIAGQELSATGINVVFGPVVDVRSTKGAFMERRTFSNDPASVASAASAYLNGLHDTNVIGVIKHFPGHGQASDSHVTLPTVNTDLQHIESIELAPFRDAIKHGAEMVMMGHLVFPALDPSNLPASLSPVIVQKILRQELGFSGVIMTDGMDMASIVDHYDRPTAAVMAIQAGVDILTVGPHTPANIQLQMKQAVLDAIKAGKIQESAINESVRRILLLKAKHGLLNWKPLDPATVDKRVDAKTHQAIVDKLYLDTVSVGQDKQKLLPLTPGQQKVAVIYPGAYPSIQRFCAALDPSLTSMSYTLNATSAEQSAARTLSRQSDVVVIFTYNIGDYLSQAALVNMVPPEKAVVVAIQSPYDIEKGIDPGAYIATFNDYPAAFDAACQVIYGKQVAVGKWRPSLGQ